MFTLLAYCTSMSQQHYSITCAINKLQHVWCFTECAAFPSLRCSSRPLLLPPTVAACFSDSLLQFFVQLLNNMLYCTNVTDLATQEYLISLP